MVKSRCGAARRLGANERRFDDFFLEKGDSSGETFACASQEGAATPALERMFRRPELIICLRPPLG